MRPLRSGIAGLLGEVGCERIGGSVVGTVSMWGRVIEHTRGARSRFAYPARLRLVCGPCLAVGAGAVTPVRVLGDHGSLTGRLPNALVRSGGSCGPGRRRRGGTPVHVRRRAVADRTALGRSPTGPNRSDLLKAPTDDPVRMYLKEIGKVPLLNAAQEVDLAQPNEAGELSTALQQHFEEEPKADPKALKLVVERVWEIRDHQQTAFGKVEGIGRREDREVLPTEVRSGDGRLAPARGARRSARRRS